MLIEHFISFSNWRSRNCARREMCDFCLRGCYLLVAGFEESPKGPNPAVFLNSLMIVLFITFWPIHLIAYFTSNIKYDTELPWRLSCKHTHIQSHLWLNTNRFFIMTFSGLSKIQKLATPRFTLGPQLAFLVLSKNMNFSACFYIFKLK